MSKVTTARTSVFRSTNFTVQSLLLLVFAFAELIGFPEEVTREMITFIEAAIFTAVGFWGQIREFIMKGIKFRYTGNVLTYVLAFIGGFVEWLNQYDLQGVLDQLISALTSGNFNLILPALFALGNILYRIVQDKPWQPKEVATE